MLTPLSFGPELRTTFEDLFRGRSLTGSPNSVNARTREEPPAAFQIIDFA
jgi:hypothetical protein